MKNLLNPKWLLFIHTAPVILLTFFLGGQYAIIKSLLTDENIRLCIIFASALFILSASTFAYSIVQTFKKKPISIYYGGITLIAHVVFLYFYFQNMSQMIPLRTPMWMLGDDVIVYVGTFLMPTMAHAVLIIVMYLTPSDKKNKPGRNFIAALMIPLSWYLFAQLIMPFWRAIDSDYTFHILIVLVIASTICFLFLLVRTVYIIIVQKTAFFIRYKWAWKIPIAILFPILGLLLNSGWFFNKENTLFSSNDGLLGNFDNLWFYLYALINGLLLCLPNVEHRLYRLLLFVGRSILFAYTFYFFLVFLPYLPFSVFATMIAGAGFLMLTPLVLFVIHIQEISADIQYLKKYFSTKLLYGISIVGFMVLPILIVMDYSEDRRVLHQALHHVYTPHYQEPTNINNTSLKNTFKVLKDHKDRNFSFQRGSQTPYLSTLFKWIVLDNMNLSDAKTETLESIFFGKQPVEKVVRNRERINSHQVELINTTLHSTFHTSSNCWISSVDLDLLNNNYNGVPEEYATTFELPEGCWISDYYLYVGDRKEKGLLTEKKAALWIYDQIVNTRRDPGILYYLTGNKVAFRVFPFESNEHRKTGIEFMHKEPIDLLIDGQTIHLGGAPSETKVLSENIQDQVFYIAAEDKKMLPIVKRKPYYHFIVDVSKGKEALQTDFIRRIESLLALRIISEDQAKISFTNAYTHTFPLTKEWKTQLQKQTFAGGYYLEYAIKNILSDSYTHPSLYYPVIVTVTDSLSHAIVTQDFGSLHFTFPENEHFYDLNSQAALETHSLRHNPKEVSFSTSDFSFNNHNVLAWPNETNTIAYLPNNSQPSIVMKGLLEYTVLDFMKEKNFSSALYMQGEWMSQALFPYTSEAHWLDLVKQSFKTKVMTPYTSYLVVETESQKEMILKKQKETLSGNKSLDLGEAPQRMSEPELYIVVLLFITYLVYKRRQDNVKRMRINT